MVENPAMFHESRGTAAGRAGHPPPSLADAGLGLRRPVRERLGPRCGRRSAFGPHGLAVRNRHAASLAEGIGCMLGLVNDTPPPEEAVLAIALAHNTTQEVARAKAALE
jgi:hypothetical protein